MMKLVYIFSMDEVIAEFMAGIKDGEPDMVNRAAEKILVGAQINNVDEDIRHHSFWRAMAPAMVLAAFHQKTLGADPARVLRGVIEDIVSATCIILPDELIDAVIERYFLRGVHLISMYHTPELIKNSVWYTEMAPGAWRSCVRVELVALDMNILAKSYRKAGWRSEDFGPIQHHLTYRGWE